MVIDGLSARRIRNYLHRWVTWWVRTTGWQYPDLLEWFLQVCWDFNPAAYAAGLLHHVTLPPTPAQVLPSQELGATAYDLLFSLHRGG